MMLSPLYFMAGTESSLMFSELLNYKQMLLVCFLLIWQLLKGIVCNVFQIGVPEQMGLNA